LYRTSGRNRGSPGSARAHRHLLTSPAGSTVIKKRPVLTLVLLVIAVLVAPALAGADRAPVALVADEVIEIPELKISAPARLPGTPLPLSRVPSSVQIITGEDLRATGAPTLQEGLRRLPGVTLSDQQGNTFQNDLSFRGFQATSVTGAPQGVSVFVDGVRINEPTVEEVNFDLIPLDDIERVELIRGPSAVFGRNTLGGTLNIVTRRGEPGVEITPEVEFGSFRRQKYHLSASGGAGPLDGYLSGTYFQEDGWRETSAARVGRLFGKVGLRGDGTDVTLSWQHVENRIEQPGSLPLSELQRDRRQNFTGGDFFKPRMDLVTVNARGELGEHTALIANAFGRWLESEQFNVNLIADNTRAFTSTLSAGGTLQLSDERTLWGHANRLAVGAEYTHHATKVTVFEEETGGERELSTRARDRQHAVGVYVQNTLDLFTDLLRTGDSLVLTVAARWDWLRHDIKDQSPATDDRPDATGVHTFARANPRVGLNYNFARDHGVYFTYGEGFRAPAFLELTCASPAAVCPGLQAGVAPDPPLKAVKAMSYELGLRSRPLPWLEGEVVLFRTDVRDDIFSVSPTGITGVFFQNIGDTRRQGVEVAIRAGGSGRLQGSLAYAYTEATFRDNVELATPRLTPGCETTTCAQSVRAGSTIPMVPTHRVSAGIDFRIMPWLTAWTSVDYVGSQHLRGDEENVERLLPGYVVVHAGLRAQWKKLSAFLTVHNLLDDEHEVFGTFARNAKLPDAPVERFLTPGAPLNVVGGLSYRF
jgi:iron complex outermembrane recepter protein